MSKILKSAIQKASENTCFRISGVCFSIFKVGVYFGLVYTVGQQEGAWSEVFI